MIILGTEIAKSNEKIRTQIFFSGIEGSALFPNPCWSTRAKGIAPLDPCKDQVLSSGFPFSNSGSADSKLSKKLLGATFWGFSQDFFLRAHQEHHHQTV